MSSLRSLLWVVPLTVLIWIYAEREQEVTLTNVTIVVAPPAGQPGRLLVHFAPGAIHSIHVDMRGRQALVEDAKELLEANAVPLELDRDLTPGDHAIDIATVLNRDPRVVSKGIQIRNCVPAEVTVTVETIKEVNVDVRARPEDVKGLPTPGFEPTKVKVTLPEADYNKAVAEDRLYVYPNLKPYSEMLAQTGKQIIQNVPLLPGFDNPTGSATISPAVVKVTVDRPNSEASITLNSFPVFASNPASARAKQFEVQWTTTIEHVTIVGPLDKVNALRNGELLDGAAFGPHADFDVDFSKPADTQIEAHLNFVLPSGMKVIDDDAKRTISYKLVPRSSANP
jgi:hypothetical protein